MAFGIVLRVVAEERHAPVGDRGAVIGRDAIDHGKAGHRRVDGAGHEAHEIGVGQPGAESAGVLRLGRAGQDAQVDRLEPALFPVEAAQILGKAFGEPVEGVGAVGDVGVDPLAGAIHADGMDRGGIDDAADAVAVGGLPHVVGAQEVRAPEVLEGLFVHDGAEMDDHVGTLDEGGDLVHAGEVGAAPGLIGQEVVGRLAQVGGQEPVAHRGKRRAQDGAERTAGPGENDLAQHGRSFRWWLRPGGRRRGCRVRPVRSRRVRGGGRPAGCGPSRGGRGRAW